MDESKGSRRLKLFRNVANTFEIGSAPPRLWTDLRSQVQPKFGKQGDAWRKPRRWTNVQIPLYSNTT